MCSQDNCIKRSHGTGESRSESKCMVDDRCEQRGRVSEIKSDLFDFHCEYSDDVERVSLDMQRKAGGSATEWGN